jgi:hypothetical protein
VAGSPNTLVTTYKTVQCDHSVISQKTVIFINIAVKTSNHTLIATGMSVASLVVSILKLCIWTTFTNTSGFYQSYNVILFCCIVVNIYYRCQKCLTTYDLPCILISTSHVVNAAFLCSWMLTLSTSRIYV